LVTTLLDPASIRPGDCSLYARRWKIELWFAISNVHGHGGLALQEPKLVHKELEMFFIAYNLIRCLMAQASIVNDAPLERLSFKVPSTRSGSLAWPSLRLVRKRAKPSHRSIAGDHRPRPSAGCPDASNPVRSNAVPRHFPAQSTRATNFRIAHRNRYWKNNPENPVPN